MRRSFTVVALATCACACAAGGRAATSAVPALIFPVVGTVDYHDDFGEPRGNLKHEGNDLIGDKRAAVVAVESGTVSYWTTSASAGCMLYLHGESGTMYEYIHLNNDLTLKNDNKGKCVQGVAYTVPDGATVVAGEQIAYLGDSGDANGIHPHLHFEVHPNGKAAVSPFRFLKKASHLLVMAPPEGAMFTLKLTGTVVSADAGQLSIALQTLAAWPSHLKQTKLNRIIVLTMPSDPTTVSTAGTYFAGEKLTAWTMPAPGTLEAITGTAGAITLDRAMPR
jgi:hypothetical protein